MTEQKALKRLARERAARTGEKCQEALRNITNRRVSQPLVHKGATGIGSEVPEAISPSEAIPPLIASWLEKPRRLFIVDEVRFTDPSEPGQEYVSFVFVETNTNQAIAFAQRALKLREALLAEQQRYVVFKGGRLFGSRQKSSHDPLRQFFAEAIGSCAGAMRVTVNGTILKHIVATAPTKIRTVPSQPGGSTERVLSGPELGLFLNMCKCVALYRKLGAVEVDVLVDRSRALGLDPRSSGVRENEYQVFEPSTLNEGPNGRSTAVECPTAFRIVASGERGFFQDLLLLPDGLGYLMRGASSFDAAKRALRTGQDPWVEEITDMSRALTIKATPTHACRKLTEQHERQSLRPR